MKRYLKCIALLLCVVMCFSYLATKPSSSGSSSSSNSTQTGRFSYLTMSCLGSSSTLPTKVQRAYATVVKDLLGLRAVNIYGHGWSTTSYVPDCPCHDYKYDHAPYVYRYNTMKVADIIAVQGAGANDYAQSVPLGEIDSTDVTTFYGALNVLMEGLKTTYPNSYIFFMTGFDIYSANAKNSAGIYWSEYNAAVINACKRHSIDCLDIYHDMPMDRDTDTVDGTHPTQKFIDKVWAPMIADFIRKNYK